MITKFRITQDQLQSIFKIGLPFIGIAGIADYKYNDDKYYTFMLTGMEDITKSFFDEVSYCGKPPILFYDLQKCEEKTLKIFMDEVNKKCSPSNEGVISLMVGLNGTEIEAVKLNYQTGECKDADSWFIVGEEINCTSKIINSVDDNQLRTQQAFGEGTVKKLSSLSIGVVGASGTGSPLIEMLYRTGVGELVIIDPDIISIENLNRILNVGTKDVEKQVFKVDALKKAIKKFGFKTKVEALKINVFTKQAVKALSRCDVIFGCTDTADSRALLNDISTFYCIPYIDVGVRLAADGKGNVNKVCYAVNYINPNGSTLEDRYTISSEEVYSATLKRTNPELYENQVREKYIKGVEVGSPAVLCVNMAASSFAFMDFMSRIHEIRSDGNLPYDNMQVDYTNMRFVFGDLNSSEPIKKNLGRGDIKPLLNKVSLS